MFEKHKERLEIIISKWGKICEIIREEIPTQKEYVVFCD